MGRERGLAEPEPLSLMCESFTNHVKTIAIVANIDNRLSRWEYSPDDGATFANN